MTFNISNLQIFIFRILVYVKIIFLNFQLLIYSIKLILLNLEAKILAKKNHLLIQIQMV